MKKLCGANNNTKRKMAEQNEDAEKAYVNSLKRGCESITNNQ